MLDGDLNRVPQKGKVYRNGQNAVFSNNSGQSYVANQQNLLGKYGRGDHLNSNENLRSNQSVQGGGYYQNAVVDRNKKRDLSLPAKDYFSRNYAVASNSIDNPYQSNKIYARNDAIQNSDLY